VSALTKSEISRAVTALRELSDIIEKLHKSTWPASDSDILRKLDSALIDEPRASAKAATAALEDLERRTAALEGARDLDAQFTRKTAVQ
jgi:hypothetical protein